MRNTGGARPRLGKRAHTPVGELDVETRADINGCGVAQRPTSRTARECDLQGNQIIAKIGIQGRVIAGAAGAPATVEIPMRVAVVQGGVNEKVIATKAYRMTVQMTEDGSVPFTLVAEDLVYPVPGPGPGLT